MEIYSPKKVDELISCPKIISEPPKKEMKIDKGYKRNDMELTSKDGKLKFSVFMRVNIDFPENFSIGLDYTPVEERGSICLLRCNSPHGEFHSEGKIPTSHFVPHIHKAKSDNIEAGFRPEKGGEPTDKFLTFEQALPYFLQKIKVIDAEIYFPKITQNILDFSNEDENAIP
jgi:hypothetical protein